MELSCSSFLSLPTTLISPHRYPIPPSSLLHLLPSLSPPKSFTSPSKLGLGRRDVRALVSEETSTFDTVVVDKIEDALLGGKGNGKMEVVVVEDGEQSESGEFLNNLVLKLDFDDTYSILINGTGALVVLWLSSAVVGAIDSIPVQNRDELLAKIEELKDQIIGDN